MVIGGGQIVRKSKNKMKVWMVKSKVIVKKTSRLDRATNHLYDLEDAHGPEKPLNIDFGLYQMEDYWIIFYLFSGYFFSKVIILNKPLFITWAFLPKYEKT